MKQKTFTINNFNKFYPDDSACLQQVYNNRYSNLKSCPQCNKQPKFHKIKSRKCYKCQYCGYELHPLAGTIFHKSSTPLKNWFYAIYLFSNSKNGVSAMELQRQLGVTYKTAWRMAKQIRLLFQQDPTQQLTDTVEADETHIGGKPRAGKQQKQKTSVAGIVQRKGHVKAIVTHDTKSSTLMPFLLSNIKLGSRVVSDQYKSYSPVTQLGYKHSQINHSLGKYVNGDIHTNTIEGFWSQFKRSVHGTYHAVSPKYLQNYLDEFAWRYSFRHSEIHFFHLFVSKAGKPV